MNSNEIHKKMHEQARAQIQRLQQPVQPDQPQPEPLATEIRIAMWLTTFRQQVKQFSQEMLQFLTVARIVAILICALTALVLFQQYKLNQMQSQLNTLSNQQAQLDQLNTKLNQQDQDITKICNWLKKHSPVFPAMSPLDAPE
jgi:uncharacterized protein YhhL (DUF1145 family)